MNWTATGVPEGWYDLDVTSLVQEVVNRPGWASGNALALLFITHTTPDGPRGDFHTWDWTDHSHAPQLAIDYLPPFVLGEHSGGQAPDNFDGSASLTDVELHKFQLYNGTGAGATVDQLTFRLSAVTGLVNGDFSSLRIMEGVSTVTSGATVDVGGGTITFAGDFAVTNGATRDLALVANVANLQNGDTLTIALPSGDVQLVSGRGGRRDEQRHSHRRGHGPPGLPRVRTDRRPV